MQQVFRQLTSGQPALPKLIRTAGAREVEMYLGCFELACCVYPLGQSQLPHCQLVCMSPMCQLDAGCAVSLPKGLLAVKARPTPSVSQQALVRSSCTRAALSLLAVSMSWNRASCPIASSSA